MYIFVAPFFWWPQKCTVRIGERSEVATTRRVFHGRELYNIGIGCGLVSLPRVHLCGHQKKWPQKCTMEEAILRPTKRELLVVMASTIPPLMVFAVCPNKAVFTHFFYSLLIYLFPSASIFAFVV